MSFDLAIFIRFFLYGYLSNQGIFCDSNTEFCLSCALQIETG